MPHRPVPVRKSLVVVAAGGAIASVAAAQTMTTPAPVRTPTPAQPTTTAPPTAPAVPEPAPMAVRAEQQVVRRDLEWADTRVGAPGPGTSLCALLRGAAAPDRRFSACAARPS